MKMHTFLRERLIELVDSFDITIFQRANILYIAREQFSRHVDENDILAEASSYIKDLGYKEIK